ncbi:MAG: hypothetical protein ACLFVU_06740 [Phycisphaerae bacterium]
MSDVSAKTGSSDHPRRETEWIHFGVATGFMVLGIGLYFGLVINLGDIFRKKAVPWPEGAEVSTQYVLESLPYEIGPFEVLDTGEFKEGYPLGIEILSDDQLDALTIGTMLDDQRRPERRSNWYCSRVYVDTRYGDPDAGEEFQNPYSPYSRWRLQVYYYTGGLDRVPHYPENCLNAAGAALGESRTVDVLLPAARSPWDDKFEINQTNFQLPQNGTNINRVVYYFFSIDGQPEANRFVVRGKLANPLQKYSYFAKVQFSPAGYGPGGVPSIDNEEEARKRAEEFLDYVFPEILQNLPTREAVEQLNAK